MMVAMASIEPTNSIDVVDGVNPDSVAPSSRLWRLSPFRTRQGTAPPDYTDNGDDLRLKGDPQADADPVTVLTNIADTQRNGLKRTQDSNGNIDVWAEPAPQTYDNAGASVGILGTVNGPVASAGNEIDLGVAASHSISNPATAFPLVVRPVISVVGARYDYPSGATAAGQSPPATLRADLTITVDGGSPSTVTRDLFYGYGGSSTIVLPAVTVAAGGSYELECDLKLIYRQDTTEEFQIAVAGCQVLFQVTEYTSTGV